MRAQQAVIVSLCLPLAGALGSIRCSTNACLRAARLVQGGRNGTADCISFLRTTVRPAARTTTTTVTVTATRSPASTKPRRKVTPTSTSHNSPTGPRVHDRRETQYEVFSDFQYGQALEGRQVTEIPRSTPIYASLCSTRGAYASACSCLGIKGVTTRAPPIVITKTRTKTATKSTFLSSSLNGTSPWTRTASWPFRNGTSSRTSTPTVYVLSTATLVTTSKARINSITSAPPNTNSAQSRPPSIAPLFLNTTASRTLNSSITSLTANSTRPLWLNISSQTRSSATGFHWLNTTSVLSSIMANSTSVRWPNTTQRANATATASRWSNVTTTPTATPNPTIDTTCGETVSPFSLKVSQSGGKFDGWFLYRVGNNLLFTSTQSSAGSFSVEATGHLCQVGYLDEDSRPRIAAVGIHDPSSDVWLVRRQTLDSLVSDYAAVVCTKDGGSLNCAANTTNPANHWLGCGLQLDLSTDGGQTVPVNGRNCTSIQLAIV